MVNTKTEMKVNRQLKILLSLSKLGFASRSQLQNIHSLGSDRNACRVLNDMKEYVNSFFDGENIFYLNEAGAEAIDYKGKLLTKRSDYQHTLMRNDLYIYFDMPDYWGNEKKFIVGDLTVIPDVFFKHDRTNQRMFVEIDNTQYMAENRRKLKRYKQLHDTKAVHKKFGYFPIILWLTKSQIRKQRLEQAASEVGLKVQVLLHNDII